MYPRSLHRHIPELLRDKADVEVADYLGLSPQAVRAIAEGRDDPLPRHFNPKVMPVYDYIKNKGSTSIPSMCGALGYRMSDRDEAVDALRYLIYCRLVTKDGHLFVATGKAWDDEAILAMLSEPRTVLELAEALKMEHKKVWKGLAELEVFGAVESKDGRLWEAVA